VDTRPAVIDEALVLLDDVDRALVRLSDGTYRGCEECGASLSEEDLVASPTLRRCEPHTES
jgi:RNA polymerase-binding transcription factor DksA